MGQTGSPTDGRDRDVDADGRQSLAKLSNRSSNCIDCKGQSGRGERVLHDRTAKTTDCAV